MEKTDLVTTISGQVVERSNCRKMSGVYYLKGDVTIENSGECYQINDRYYKYNTGYIVYDHSVKSYILKSKFNECNNTEKGIIGFKDDNEPIFGSFTIKNLSLCCKVNTDNGIYYCIDEDILINNNLYLENLDNGVYYKRDSIDSYKFIFPPTCSRSYKNSLPYDSRNITKKYTKLYDEFYDKTLYPKLEGIKTDLTKDLSFGLEFETTIGNIPDRVCNKLGLIPLRDGSIEGLEFVTIPLENTIGVQTVFDILQQLNKRTKYDNDCSLHIHIGNIPRTEEFFIAIYKMLFILQEDMYSFFPFHKKENYGIKRKHYTKPLPLDLMLKLDSRIETKQDITKNFSYIYDFLSMGQDYKNVKEDLTLVKSHPSDPGGNSKWNIRTRYHWVNLIPLLFGNKQTIEFRIHTPTYDYNKVINYMLICFSIVSYTIKYQDKILKNFNSFVNININDIILEMYNDKKCSQSINIVRELHHYLEKRRNYFFIKTKHGDFLANEDDFNYKYRYFNWDLSSEKTQNKSIFKKTTTMANIIENELRNLNNRLPNFEELVAPMPFINDVNEVVEDNLFENDDLEELQDDILGEIEPALNNNNLI